MLVTGFSFMAYVANRIFGARRGTISTALIGGAYSSTAVTQSLAQRLGSKEAGGAEAAGIALATAVMYLRVIVLVAIITPSIKSIVVAIAVVSWPPVARLVRGEFLTLRSRDFVQACVGLGMSDGRVIFRHLLPNCLSPIVVTGSLIVATAILIESALSFLGLGDPNTMSWGFMIGAGRTFLRSAWWLCTIPGVAILLTVLAINLLGEGLNDALNPRLGKSPRAG